MKAAGLPVPIGPVLSRVWDDDKHNVLGEDPDAMPSIPLKKVRKDHGQTAHNKVADINRGKLTGEQTKALRSRYLQKFELTV